METLPARPESRQDFPPVSANLRRSLFRPDRRLFLAAMTIVSCTYRYKPTPKRRKPVAIPQRIVTAKESPNPSGGAHGVERLKAGQRVVT